MEYRIGMDLGGTNIAAGLVAGGELLVRRSVPTRAAEGEHAVIARMVSLVRELSAECGAGPGGVASLGVGTPGAVEPDSGRVLFCNNLGWRDVALRERLGEATGLPVAVGNDADCAALGEALFGGERRSDMALLTIGTGVGLGVVRDGTLVTGMRGAAGEFGHTTLIAGGELCSCGRRGCLERYAAFPALIRAAQRAADGGDIPLARLRDEGCLNGREIFALARGGSERAAALVSSFIGHIGDGVVNLVNLLDPGCVVIGGGIAPEGEYVLAPIREKLSREAYLGQRLPPVVMAALGGDAGILGAAALTPRQ
ncbi:ROK family protein [Feifania hominis]|uniref:ROK family protein n=1 Tax=Feifania hominis TaxID=2763660 RepID=A0A926DEL6_9FIRM|nr:ROK family protein [Feifania hominis]MBC8536791.1 ROK family protein [Feifania hominis]